MKKINKFLVIFIIFILLISFITACEIGDVDVFGIAGMIRYSWVMYLFIPIYILIIFYCFKLKKNKIKYKLKLSVSFICVFLLCIFGSYRFIFPQIYDDSYVSVVLEKVNIELPENTKIITEKYNEYTLSNIKLIDLEEKSNFEDEIKTDDRWYEVISSQLIGALPIFLQYDLHLFDYYLTYEETKGIYGSNFDASGDYSIILLAYNISLSKLMVISDLEISVVI